MMHLRRILVGLAAVCLAFAAGIAIGNGPLQQPAPVRDDVSLAQAKAEYQARLQALQQSEQFGQTLSAQAAQALLADRLEHTSVAIFEFPGVRASTVSNVTQAVVDAGAEVTISGHLTQALVDPAKKTYVDSVAESSLHGTKDLAASQSLPTYGRIGALLARAYTGPGNALAVDDEASRIDAQLQGAKLVTLHDGLQRRANAVIVLADGDHGSADSIFARHQIEVQVVDALAGRGDGLVLSAPSTSSEPGGLLKAVADAAALTNAFTTVNVLDTEPGKVTTAAALVSTIAGTPGNYGLVDGEVVVPPIFASEG